MHIISLLRSRLEQAGWARVATIGSHCQFKHPFRPGRVTVPHPGREMPIGTLKSTERQSRRPHPQGCGQRLRRRVARFSGLHHGRVGSDVAADQCQGGPGPAHPGDDLGETIPTPTELRDVDHDGAVLIVDGRHPQVMRLNVALPKALVGDIDRATPDRSRVLAEAARETLRAL